MATRGSKADGRGLGHATALAVPRREKERLNDSNSSSPAIRVEHHSSQMSLSSVSLVKACSEWEEGASRVFGVCTPTSWSRKAARPFGVTRTLMITFGVSSRTSRALSGRL